MKTGRGQTTESATLPSGLCRFRRLGAQNHQTYRLCNWATTWLWGSSGAHQAVSDQIEEPELVYFAQVNVCGVFEDETPDVMSFSWMR